MRSGIKLKNSRFKNNFSLRFYLVMLSILFVAIILHYTETLKRKTIRETHVLPQLFARFVFYSSIEPIDSNHYQNYLNEVISRIDYPIIVTDNQYKPLFWKNIKVSDTEDYTELSKHDKRVLRRMTFKLRRTGHKVPLRIANTVNGNLTGYVLYADPPAIDRLKYLPYLQLFLICIFILSGFFAYSIIKSNEKDYIWIGLAKETAHQFGTPITSLFGWIEVMRLRFQHFDNNKDINSMLDHMETDISILQKVASRFNKIGSQIKLSPHAVDEVIQASIDYFTSRLPHFSNRVDICFINQAIGLNVQMDAELFQWAIDNLLKNAIDSMQKKGGNIFVTLTKEKKKLSIIILDEGCGIPKNIPYKNLFDPGITTKERGWGLGLSLTKRIVEEYHNGKVKILHSRVNEGTSIEISLPLFMIDASK